MEAGTDSNHELDTKLRDKTQEYLCFVLFCFVLFCFVLFCFVLFCFVLFCFVLFCFVLFCFVLFCFVFESIRYETAQANLKAMKTKREEDRAYTEELEKRAEEYKRQLDWLIQQTDGIRLNILFLSLPLPLLFLFCPLLLICSR